MRPQWAVSTICGVKDYPVQVKMGRSYRWFFLLLFGGVLGALVLVVLVVYWEGEPGHPVGVYLMALGVALVPAAVIPALRVRGQLQRGERAQGTVVGAEQREGSRGDIAVTYYHPRVQFTMPDGRTVVFTSAYGSETEPEVGYPLKVRYPPDDPSRAELDSAVIWALPAVVGSVFGLAALVGGVVAYLKA
jgi:hypothetical protein